MYLKSIFCIQIAQYICIVNKTTMKKLFTSAEAAELLKVTTRTLQTWRDTGAISFIKIMGGKIFYTQEHIDELLKTYEVKAYISLEP
jgi:excisionase family DNA binding protein